MSNLDLESQQAADFAGIQAERARQDAVYQRLQDICPLK